MTITTYERDGHSCPIVVCDWCGARITDLRGGNAYWVASRPDTVYYNHKSCAHAHELSLSSTTGESAIYSEDLETFMAFLLGNTGAPMRAMWTVDEAGNYGRGRDS